MTMVKPGHTSLNMQDISEDLRVVHRHVTKVAPTTIDPETGKVIDMREEGSIDKPVLPEFRKKIVKADDVDQVAGVDADRIAVAVSEDDRTTINNALNLGGRPADDFTAAEEGQKIKRMTTEVTKHYGDDIASIRDELYQLKHALEKNGLVHLTNEHFGYNDTFRNGYLPYEYEELGRPTIDCPAANKIRLDEEAVAKIDEGDYIAIYFRDEEKVDVIQVAEIGPDGQTLTLDEGMTHGNLTKENIIVYKSFGVSRDGNFYFARDVEFKVGDENIWTGLDDDTTTTLYRPVTEEQSSYGYGFRIPETKQGFLTKFQIYTHAIGNPTLTCYIFDEQDIGNFKNPVQAENLYKSGDVNADGEPKMHFFAKSKPVSLDPTLGEHIVTFDFWNADSESYPLIQRKDTPTNRVRYVAVICGTFVDSNNYANIRFIMNSSEEGGDLETNNKVYRYSEQLDTAVASALSHDPKDNNKDMYYAVIMREAIRHEMDAQTRGLYSAIITSPKGMPVSRARLTMRVKREGGLWDANITEPGVYGISERVAFPVEVFNNFPTKKASFRTTDTLGLQDDIRLPMELRTDDKIFTRKPDTIIGSNIVKGSPNNTSIIPAEPIMVKPNDMVYRNAYQVSVKGKLYEYDEEKKKFIVTSQNKVFLKPIAVIPDGCKDKKDVYSDRIIWEGDFRTEAGNPLYFNELELQVFWHKPAFSELNMVANEQMGIIHDLVFSTDRTV